MSSTSFWSGVPVEVVGGTLEHALFGGGGQVDEVDGEFGLAGGGVGGVLLDAGIPGGTGEGFEVVDVADVELARGQAGEARVEFGLFDLAADADGVDGDGGEVEARQDGALAGDGEDARHEPFEVGLAEGRVDDVGARRGSGGIGGAHGEGFSSRAWGGANFLRSTEEKRGRKADLSPSFLR